jgi:small subunit ribosomal protein S17e
VISIGRIRTDDIKKTSRELIKKYPDKFSNDNEKNKAALNEMKIIFEKKLRNRIAGYITRTIVVNTRRKPSPNAC